MSINERLRDNLRVNGERIAYIGRENTQVLWEQERAEIMWLYDLRDAGFRKK